MKKTIWNYYKNHKRDLEWRKTTNPYLILVSEIMLQQTQVPRVQIKYRQFITAFPNFISLANAPLSQILQIWQGMGYNRRAIYLHKIAQKVVSEFDGSLPDDLEILQTFPGIGHATARSIVCFAWNKPVTFIETNIRRVFIHHYFKDQKNINDKDILPLVEKKLDRTNPREWYYALMDYGAHLAKKEINPNRRSKHYAKQSSFTGSKRQLRGLLLRTLLKKPMTKSQLEEALNNDRRAYQILEEMKQEGFIKEKKGAYIAG